MIRNPHSHIRTSLALAAIGTSLVVAGCSANTEAQSKAIDQDVVARKATESLSKKVGEKPDSVTCSKDLPLQQGATVRCILTEGGESIGLTATVAETNGDEYRLNFQVDQQPRSSENASAPA